MIATTLRCPACGATLKVDGTSTHFNCEYCQNPINIIKPLTSNAFVEGLTEIEQNKYSNYLSILEQAMLAGNYSEGYNYCNKGLEINPKSAELWANKAICSLWLSTVSQISEDKAMEIITYLNACKSNDPDSKIYSETSELIAENLYYCALYRYNTLQPDQYNPNGITTYSFENEKAILSCIRIMQLCFQISQNYTFLIKELELINIGKIYWFSAKGGNSNSSNRQGFDAVKTRGKLIVEIKNNYNTQKLEVQAQSDYNEFCNIANEFYRIDRSFYIQHFSPIVQKYKPQKLPLTPEQLKMKKRSKIIVFIILGIIILFIILIVIYASKNSGTNEIKNNTKFNLTATVEFSDSIKALKTKYDEKYLKAEFIRDNDNTVFAQKTIVIEDKNINDIKAKEITEFYKDYFQKPASIRYNNRFVLNMWFYTLVTSKTNNPSTFTEKDIKNEKYLYGSIIYNYDTKTYKGTIK